MIMHKFSVFEPFLNNPAVIRLSMSALAVGIIFIHMICLQIIFLFRWLQEFSRCYVITTGTCYLPASSVLVGTRPMVDKFTVYLSEVCIMIFRQFLHSFREEYSSCIGSSCGALALIRMEICFVGVDC